MRKPGGDNGWLWRELGGAVSHGQETLFPLSLEEKK